MAPIGIPDGAPADPDTGLIDEAVLALAPPRAAGSTKFSSGQVLVAGGSRGLTGAVCMASSAAIRAGAGYATAAVPADVEAIVEAKLTEVMTVGCASREGRLRRAASEQIMEAAESAAAVVLGPGMGGEDGTRDLARQLAKRIEAPLVLDADGLNAHAGKLELLKKRSGPVVLTPHEGELGKLLRGRLAGRQGQAPQPRGRGGAAQRRHRPAQGRRHDRHRRRAGGHQPRRHRRARDGRDGRRALGDDRGADRPRHGPLHRRPAPR